MSAPLPCPVTPMNSVVLLFFPLVMAYAASSDLLTMRISNKIVLVLAAGFPIVAVMMNLPLVDMAMHFAAALLVLAVAFTFFSFGWIGGGDAKLAAATTLWLGFAFTLPYMVYAALLGGVLTIAIVLLRTLPLPPQLASVSWIGRLHDRTTGIPYGLALAAAGLLVYAKTPVFAHFSA